MSTSPDSDLPHPPPAPPDPEAGSPTTAGSQQGEEAGASGARASSMRSILEWLVVLVGALLLAFVIKATVVQTFRIPSESMVPTLNVGDRILVNKLSYDLHEVHRGDIVVFERPDGEDDPDIKDLIKRVIGLPGDTIEARDGQVLINGRVLKEPYLPEGTVTVSLPPQRVPADRYFMMGDNRSNSRDSRFFRAVPKRLLVGRAFVRVWPLTRLGGL